MKKIINNKIVQFLLIFILLILLFSIIFPNTRIAGFFKGGFHSVFGGVEKTFYNSSMVVKDTFQSIFKINEIRSQKEKLQAENRKLREENSQLKEVKVENSILREQLKLTERVKDLNLEATEIIGRGVGGFQETLLINKGRNQKVKEGDSLVSGEFLVGSVVEVYSNSSQVRIITSIDSVINGLLQASRAKGVVKGQIGYGLTMESIPKDTNISKDEAVITSGLGGTYPKGLIIGYVDEVTSGQGDIFKVASLTTPINFSDLEVIFLVK
jgi:rod shape-determining protein MreC